MDAKFGGGFPVRPASVERKHQNIFKESCFSKLIAANISLYQLIAWLNQIPNPSVTLYKVDWVLLVLLP